MFCGYRHVKIDHKKCFVRGKVYINGVEGFLEFCQGAAYKVSWYLQGEVSTVLEGDGVQI